MTLYTEIDPFCCEVLLARVADGGLPRGEVWERDICTITDDEVRAFSQVHLFCGIGGSPLGLRWAGWPADWSIVTGGFPCQDISVAGKGEGIDGARSGLWKEMHRVIDAVRPVWVIAENVPALRTRGIDRVLGDMERIGYECWPLVVGADDIGAPHRRKRVWIVGRLADSALGGNGTRCGISVRPRRQDETSSDAVGAGDGLADSERDGRGAGRGERGDESGEGRGRGESARGVQLAHAAGGGQRTDRGARQGDGDTDEQCEVERAVSAGREEPHAARFADQSRLRGWPVAPGCEQHEWEAPRLVYSAGSRRDSGESGTGRKVRNESGRAEPERRRREGSESQGQPQLGMGGATHGLPGRVARYLNRKSLKALGNSQVPQCVEVIARGIIAAVGRGREAVGA